LSGKTENRHVDRYNDRYVECSSIYTLCCYFNLKNFKTLEGKERNGEGLNGIVIVIFLGKEICDHTFLFIFWQDNQLLEPFEAWSHKKED